MKKNKAFTLIELIAVLVILAILALIVTPLVMNIIRKARISADKRSIDAYGRSIELAIASYLLDEGKFPSSINDLTIEYSGDEVVCSTTQLNDDSSVYLTGCTVKGRTVDYAYGKYEEPTYVVYSVGDEVTYNGVDYYVLADSSLDESSVTLLKATPLTVDEVNTYGGVGTDNNRVNMYTTSDSSLSFYQTAGDMAGYGTMAYYSSELCGVNSGAPRVETGCTTVYGQSDIKYVVDAWKTSKAPLATEARLITFEELTENLGYELKQYTSSSGYGKTDNTPIWVYNSNYSYWTMSSYNDSSSEVYTVGYGLETWNITFGGESLLTAFGIYSGQHFDGSVVRPVIVLPKSLISA